MWAHLSQLVSLRCVRPRSWSADLTGADWGMLGQMPELAEVWLRMLPPPPPLPGPADDALHHMLVAASQCPRLWNLRLEHLFLSIRHLTMLLQALPLLARLHLAHVAVESLAALTQAQALTDLRLEQCSGPNEADDPVEFRTALPPLPFLTHLAIISDSEPPPAPAPAPAPPPPPKDPHAQAAERADLNARLLQRMPRLTMENFHQS